MRAEEDAILGRGGQDAAEPEGLGPVAVGVRTDEDGSFEPGREVGGGLAGEGRVVGADALADREDEVVVNDPADVDGQDEEATGRMPVEGAFGLPPQTYSRKALMPSPSSSESSPPTPLLDFHAR